MASTPTLHSQFSEDTHIWANLKQAIANSSGFQRWKQEQDTQKIQNQGLDLLVRCYLRETLETLAY